MSTFSQFEAFEKREGIIYELKADLVWNIGKKESGWSLTIPKGREFDISVPRWLRWILSPDDRCVLPAAAIHDELLNQGHDVAFASSEFRRAVLARGGGMIWAWMLFWATLVWTAWRAQKNK